MASSQINPPSFVSLTDDYGFLTRVGVDMKEYIEWREVEKRRDGSTENERGRTRGKKARGEVEEKQKKKSEQDLCKVGD